jgi:hypothetical protein
MNATAQRATPRQSLFGLFGGPLAWYLQLCAGYALASQPCFRGGLGVTAPLRTEQWTWPAMILAMLTAVAVALLALLVSWRTFVRTRAEGSGGVTHMIEAGDSRTQFLALWGVLLGAAFALAAAISAVAFITLPRCAG